MYQTSPCHIRLLSSSLLTHPIPPCIFHILPLCEFCSTVCHKGTSVLFPPPPDYWHTSFVCLAGPGPLHEIAVSAFSRSPLGREHTSSFLFLQLTPRKSLECSSSFTLLHSASLSLISIFSFLSCTPQTSLWTVYIFLVSSNILPYFLDYAIPPYSSSPFCYLLPYSPISYGWQPLFWHVLYYILSFQLSHVPICFKWVHSQFCC